MKNQNGFTLVEVIVALALVTMITGILATSLAQTLRYFNDANVYKKESDAAFDTIQSDSNDIQYKTEYKLVSTDSDNKKNSVRVRVSSYTDKSSKNKLTYQSIDVIDLIKMTPDSIRQKQDNVVLNKLAKYAAGIIKEKGTSAIDNCLSGSYRSAIYGNGLEILHFREGGWPVEANTNYYTQSNDRNPQTGYYDYGQQYETQNYYKNYPKIGTAPGYTQGFKKNDGFFYETFANGIGFDLTKVGNPIYGKPEKEEKSWRGINYDYNSLLFGSPIMDLNNRFRFSLFMKVDKSAQTVTIWVNRIAIDGSSDSSGINNSYTATASYA